MKISGFAEKNMLPPHMLKLAGLNRLNKVKMDQKRPRNRVFAPKMHFFAGILFLDHTPLEEIILNEVRLGGSPTIDFALHTRLS